MVNVDVQVTMTLKYFQIFFLVDIAWTVLKLLRGPQTTPPSPPGLNKVNRIKRSNHIMIVSLMHFINVFHRQVRKTYNDIWIQKTYKLLPIELVPSRDTNRCSFLGGFLDRYQVDTRPDFTWNDNHISNRQLPNRRAGRISERLLRKGNWYLPHRVLCVCVWLHGGICDRSLCKEIRRREWTTKEEEQ